MAVDLTKLSAELAKDEYADMIAAGDHASLAAVLNARDNPSRRVQHADMTRAEFVANYAAITDRISDESDPAKIRRWDWRNNELSHMETVSLDSPSTKVILRDLVADGYADQAAAMLVAAEIAPPGLTGEILMTSLSSQPASIAEHEGIVAVSDDVTGDEITWAWNRPETNQ